MTTPRPDVVVGDDGIARCGWGASGDEYRRYHDDEWGVPQHDSVRLFEKLCLEGFQAGLSWITILKRRPAFRDVFHGFDPAIVSSFGHEDVERLLGDARIIRHRGKIEAAIANARAVLALDETLAEFLWSFAPPPRADPPIRLSDLPSTSAESTAMSRALRDRGFRFVGPTTMYALMQATGMVDDHLVGCFRAAEPPAR